MPYPKTNAPFIDDGVYEDDDGDDGSYEPDSEEKSKKKPTRKSTKGRKLKRWDADEDQKLLLYIDYVCTEKGVVLPWDKIAATMEPRDAAKGEKPMTGEAIKQHLAKLRDHREGEGHAVPPKLDRGARRLIVGKNTPSTPAPTPRKVSGSSDAPVFREMFSVGRGKGQGAEKETPVKKGSSLVAPVSKSKQKKAEKAMREALLSSGSGHTTGTNSGGDKLAGGLKAMTGKRGRRQAAAAAALATEDQDRDDTASGAGVRGRLSRRPERKSHAGMGSDLAELGIKDEPQSEDDLPLSKRRDTGQTLGKKKTAIGLMGDTVQMWQNRNGKSAVGGSAAQSPEVQQSIEQVVGVPSNGNCNRNNQEGHAGLSQATLDESPNDGGFLSVGSQYQDDFHLPQATVGVSSKEMRTAFNPVNYQAHDVQGRVDQQLSGDAFGTFYPQIESGHPSPMDYDLVNYQAYGRRCGAPGQIYVPRHSNNYTGQFSNDFPLTSSPAYDSLSSATFAGCDPSQPASGNTSTKTSFSNTQVLQDPFTANNCNEYFGGLPSQDPPTLGNWGAQSNQTAAAIRFDAEYQYPSYNDSQISSGYVNPTLTMPASGPGLGISQSHSADNNFGPSTETKTGHAFPANPHLDQPVVPAFGTAMGSPDLGDPHDPFLPMNDLFEGNFLPPLHGDDCDG
ncbi:hypothetical protein MBLNU13_g05639t2 [Cladosporium sp. NU13]